MEHENAKCFIDTNILIYAYSSTELDKKKTALSLLEREYLCLSTQVINEFLWVMNKKFQIDWNLLRMIMHNLFAIYQVGLISEMTIGKALDLTSRLHFSYWDSLMLSSALEASCSVLFTEDLKHGQIIENQITVLNPFL